MKINMSIYFVVGLTLLVSYLLGCFNGSVVTSHFIIRDDVRKHGSGNAGLTNFYRTYGAKYALIVIFCDMGKTVLSCLIGGYLMLCTNGGWTLGVLLGGFGAASMSMPAALAITVGADLGSGWYHVTIAAAISYYFRKICKSRDYSRSISLIFAVAAVMVLGGDRQWIYAALTALGGLLGALLPLPVPKRAPQDSHT